MILLMLQLYWTFLKIGIFSFGGGYVMLPLIEATVVQKGWISINEFIDIIAIAEMTPGTIAVNTATYIGYNIAGIPGSLVATLGVITPSAVILLGFGNMLFRLKDNPRADSLLKGLRPAFIALIAMAAFFVGQHSLIDLKTSFIFSGLFFVFFIKKISPFLIIAGGAFLGLILFPY